MASEAHDISRRLPEKQIATMDDNLKWKHVNPFCSVSRKTGDQRYVETKLTGFK